MRKGTLLELSPIALAGCIYGDNDSETEVPEYEAGPVPDNEQLDAFTNLWVGMQMRMYLMDHNISGFQMAQIIGISGPNGIARLESHKYPETYVRRVAAHYGVHVESLLGERTVEHL